MSHIFGWTQGVWYLEQNPWEKIRNSKLEIRNKSEYRMFKIQNENLNETTSSVECSKSKECVSRNTRFCHLNFDIALRGPSGW